jgi:methionine-rich copper-binding protein CopC
MRQISALSIGMGLLLAQPALAAGVRDFTRSAAPERTISEAQASELTLTLTEAAMRPIQHLVRVAGTLDATGRLLTAHLRSPDAELIQPGQRLRAFSVNSRTRMHQGRIVEVARQRDGIRVQAALPAQASQDGVRYLLEIAVERGPYLSIPNVAIIEEGSQHIVYVQEAPGRYFARAIETGLQGELYTQVVSGLTAGDQVVSVGSFFVDADSKLKLAGMAPMPGMDHSQMPGMQSAAPPGREAAGATEPGANMVTSDPAPNARVSAPVYMIHVMFPQRVEAKTSRFQIADKAGKEVDAGQMTWMGNEGTMLMAMLKTPLPAGTYRVKWNTVGADAKKLEGEFSFTAQ